MADDDGRFKMLAVDQRPPIKGPIAKARGLKEAPYLDVAMFKRMLIETLQGEATAALLDPHYAYPFAIDALSPRKGLVVTLEDSIFHETGQGRLSSEIDHWSVDKIKRLGGDAVKVLIWYRPDAGPDVLRAQKDFGKRIGEHCARFDIPFLLELLVYPLANDAEQTRDYVEMQSKRADQVLESVEEFAKPDYLVDVFKLESPVPAAMIKDRAYEAQRLFDEMGKLAGRPWVMLSAGAGKDDFETVLGCAYRAGASGFLAGRAIWLDAFDHFPDWDRVRSDLAGEAVQYMRAINALTDAQARPWFEHPLHAGQPMAQPADASFRIVYPEAHA